MKLLYVANFLSKADADALFAACDKLSFVRRPNPRDGGKTFLKRGTITFQDGNITAGAAEPNQFHNTVISIADAPPEIQSLRNALTAEAGTLVNYLSLNKYPEGTTGIGYHNHKEDLEINTPVLLVSVGAERTMWIRPMLEEKGEPTLLQHGSLFLMPAELNATHQHAILPEKNIKTVRYSLNCKCLPFRSE